MPSPDDRSAPAWQRLASAYLGRIADGEDVDLDELRGELEHPEERARFAATALVEEYLWRLSGGESVDVAHFRSRLSGDAERDLFDAGLDDARHAARRLPMHIVPGSLLLDRFRVVEVLGEGGMATVYEVEDLDLQRRVALKVIRGGVGPASVDRDALLEESRLLARLDCPNITRVFDVLRDGERRYIAMDLVRGVDLKSVLGRVRRRVERTRGRRKGTWLSDAIDLPAEEGRADRVAPDDWFRTSAAIVRALVRAVELAHTNGIVHRDLKPGNVMLTARCDPVLLDFGLAGRVDEGEGDDAFHGTPSYVAPEQIEAWKSGRDPRTDVYQIGLLLYELLTLEIAFPQSPDETLEALFFRIARGDLRDPGELAPDTPPSLLAICRRALATDPDERYQDLAQMGSDLERFERGLPPAVARVRPAHALWLRTRYALRRPATAVAAATSVALVLGVAQVAASLRWSGPELVPFALAAGAEQPMLLDGASRIAAQDSLCLRAEGDDASQLYVLVQLGGADPSQRSLRPVRPQLLSSASPAPREAWPVALEPGTQLVVCATEAPRSARAGLLAFACAERDALLDGWMAGLDAWLVENEAAPGVPYDTARRLLDEHRLRARGDAPDMTPEEWERRYGAFLDAFDRGQVDWGLDELDGIVRFEFLCDVDLGGSF